MTDGPTLPKFALRMDRIEPGDILLTCSPEKSSETIKFFSQGDYSHAALFVASGIIFESDGKIIGNKLVKDLGWWARSFIQEIFAIGNGRN
ncbi:MAG TPA: hypothetical protein VKW08_16965 [Xanthobacteraceae bacterium]|nr:hypothetical protein [Xanthobacteraceae bacterium]